MSRPSFIATHNKQVNAFFWLFCAIISREINFLVIFCKIRAVFVLFWPFRA